jgi:HlyD family secretion protein
MEMRTADAQAQVTPEPPKETRKQVAKQAPKKQAPASTRIPSIIVGLVVAAVAGLSIWYLVRGEPLLVQGEVDATRLDIAARVVAIAASVTPAARCPAFRDAFLNRNRQLTVAFSH